MGEECTKAEEGSEERQEDDSKEEYYIEEFSKWNDDKGEVNETRHNKMKKMMSTNKTISLRLKITLARKWRRKQLLRWIRRKIDKVAI